MFVLSDEQLNRGYFRGIGGFTLPGESHPKPENIRKQLKDYKGEERTCVACTQLDPRSGFMSLMFECWSKKELKERIKLTEKQEKRMVQEWVDFLSTNTKTLKGLHFNSCVPQMLFDATCCQENLEELRCKWGSFSDLSALEKLKNLKFFYHDGFRSKIRDISVLGKLENLIVLHLTGFNKIEDFTPLANLKNLQQLIIIGTGESKGRRARLQDLELLRELPKLRSFGFGNVEIYKEYTLEELADLRVSLPNLIDRFGFFPALEKKIIKASRKAEG